MKTPVVFAGHGSPMNAVEDNAFTACLSSLARELPRPRAILVVSAHWLTAGTWVGGMERPRTIHDFYGFSPELFRIQYPAPGSPETAALVRDTVREPAVEVDREQWGLDHGTWAVLRRMYPEADLPVLQLSVNIAQPAEYHLAVGRALRPLREQGVLILGSGNLVHNLQRIRWKKDAAPFDWALEFDDWARRKLEARDEQALTRDYLASEAGRLSVPTPDHYYPMLYALGAADPADSLRFPYEGVQNGSIAMRTLVFG